MIDRRLPIPLTVVVFATGLGACGAAGNNRDVCSPIVSEATAEQTWLMIDPKQPATQGLLGQPIDKQAYSRRGYMDFCVQKWGYVLGPGNAVNESSAEAVIGACAEPLKELDLAEGQEDEARTHAHTFAWPHSSEATGQTVSI